MTQDHENLLKALDRDHVLRTVPSGLFLVDREQKIVYWSPEAERITGYCAEEVVGRHCSLLEGIECGMGCGLYNEKVDKPLIGVPCTVKAKNGRRLHLLKNVDYLRNGTGKVVGGVESFIDITPQKRLEKQLRRHLHTMEKTIAERTAELERERSRLAMVLDAMADFAYICGDDYCIRFMNRAMVEAFGDLVGKPCYQLFSETQPCAFCPLGEVLAGRTARQERVFEKDGHVYEVIHTPLSLPGGGAQKLSVFRDITERKEMEQRLREANRELDAFVYTVSHDLRTPLTPIIGFAEFLKEGYNHCLDENAMGILAEIEGQGKRMLALMEDLLALSRVGSLDLPAEPIATPKVVREVLEELKEEVKEKEAMVQIGFLPAALVPETLLFEVFNNLIGNALRYAGGPGRPIEVGGAETDGRVRFFFRDHGPGVAVEDRERIFELFYRGQAALQTRGTGIGLAIVQKIARRLGGRAWVEETPGGGATFWVEFAPRDSREGENDPG